MGTCNDYEISSSILNDTTNSICTCCKFLKLVVSPTHSQVLVTLVPVKNTNRNKYAGFRCLTK